MWSAPCQTSRAGLQPPSPGATAGHGHGWIVALGDPAQPGAQINLMTHNETASVVPAVPVQVQDVDTAYSAAVAEGAEIVHP